MPVTMVFWDWSWILLLWTIQDALSSDANAIKLRCSNSPFRITSSLRLISVSAKLMYKSFSFCSFNPEGSFFVTVCGHDSLVTVVWAASRRNVTVRLCRSFVWEKVTLIGPIGNTRNLNDLSTGKVLLLMKWKIAGLWAEDVWNLECPDNNILRQKIIARMKSNLYSHPESRHTRMFPHSWCELCRRCRWDPGEPWRGPRRGSCSTRWGRRRISPACWGTQCREPSSRGTCPRELRTVHRRWWRSGCSPTPQDRNRYYHLHRCTLPLSSSNQNPQYAMCWQLLQCLIKYENIEK